MTASRLPRFTRSANIPTVEITSRDRQIIQIVYEHRFLRSSQIAALTGVSLQPLLRRLQLLYHHGYLERPRAQLDYYHRSGSHPIVYGLGNKGAALLSRELGIPFGKIRWGEKNRSVGRPYLEHALFVSDLMVAIELACRQQNNVRLITGQQLMDGNAKRKMQAFRWRVSLNPDLVLGIMPDRVFALEYADALGTTERAYFFLEADRGTMPVTRKSLSQTSMSRKLVAYEATWSQGVHRRKFGFHRFRVITVTKTAERLHSLVSACTQLKSGHGIFLFADWNSLKNARDILTAPWKTGRQGEPANLLS